MNQQQAEEKLKKLHDGIIGEALCVFRSTVFFQRIQEAPTPNEDARHVPGDYFERVFKTGKKAMNEFIANRYTTKNASQAALYQQYSYVVKKYCEMKSDDYFEEYCLHEEAHMKEILYLERLNKLDEKEACEENRLELIMKKMPVEEECKALRERRQYLETLAQFRETKIREYEESKDPTKASPSVSTQQKYSPELEAMIQKMMEDITANSKIPADHEEVYPPVYDAKTHIIIPTGGLASCQCSKNCEVKLMVPAYYALTRQETIDRGLVEEPTTKAKGKRVVKKKK